MKTKKLLWPALLAKWVVEWSMFLGNIILGAMLCIVFLNVLMRYFFREPIYWGDEIMTYLMILVAFLGFGFNLKEGRHISMTALIVMLSEKARNYIGLITGLIAVVYFVFLLIAGIYLTIDSFEIGYFSMVTGLPIGPWQAAMCFGLFILLTASLWNMINRIKTAFGKKEGKPTDVH
ncbi:MAG: TRAP transporter small permease [Deltaproteobacteria bacterium]|nr:TRAP transporter small permease [Deltaproteobacteria bacterium]